MNKSAKRTLRGEMFGPLPEMIFQGIWPFDDLFYLYKLARLALVDFGFCQRSAFGVYWWHFASLGHRRRYQAAKHRLSDPGRHRVYIEILVVAPY